MSESAAVRLFEQAKVINQLQRELEEVKRQPCKCACHDLPEHFRFQDLAEAHQWQGKEIVKLRQQLAASEAKVERMKTFLTHKNSCGKLEVIGYAVRKGCTCGLDELLSEPPSTSLDLYHKERNKKELGEVLGLLDSIMCDPDGNCDICGSDEDRKIGQQALSILKRLTE